MLLLALSDGACAWFIGACRLRVLAGEVTVLGAVLCAGAEVDIVSPPFDGAAVARATGGNDLRLAAAGSAECAALLAELSAQGIARRGGCHCAAVALSHVPQLAGYLDGYAVGGTVLAHSPWSTAVRGACVGAVNGGVVGTLWPYALGNKDSLETVPAVPSSNGQGGATCRSVDRYIEAPAPWVGIADTIVGHATASLGYGAPRLLPVVVVTGPKGSGKSTFGRYLLHRLLAPRRGVPPSLAAEGGELSALECDVGGPRSFARVAWLDVDVGQPEHTVAGMLSLTIVDTPLLTPPHARTQFSANIALEFDEGIRTSGGSATVPVDVDVDVPHRNVVHVSTASASIVAAHFLGSTSPKTDPAGFAAATSNLIAVYRRHLASRGIPLIVNTHGWVRGAGYTATQALIDELSPSHLVVLDASAAAAGAAPLPAWDGGAYDDADGVPAEVDAAVEALPGDEGMTERGGSRSTIAAAARGGRGTGRRPGHLSHTEHFVMPTTVYQPWSTATRVDNGAGALRDVWGSNLVPVHFNVAAWHATPSPLIVRHMYSHPAASPESAASRSESAESPVGGRALPPRAARSPAELRWMRLMSYLLWRIRAPGDEREDSDDAHDGDGGADHISGQEGVCISEGPVEDDAAATDRVTDEARRAVDSPGTSSDNEIQMDTFAEEGDAAPRSERMQDSGASIQVSGGVDYVDDDGSDTLNDASGEVSVAETEDGPLSPDASASLLRASAAGDVLAVAHLMRASIAAALRTVFWRIQSEKREARAPTSGIASPAYALSTAAAVSVPLSDVIMLADAMEDLPVRAVIPDSCRCDGAEARCAACFAGVPANTVDAAHVFIGQLVGLCCRAHTDDAVTRASLLPCVGIGLVRSVDATSGTLTLVTPVPLRVLKRVNVLVGWAGGGALEMPPQLLFRGQPSADAYAVPAHTVVPAVSASARNSANRVNLKRARLGGGR